MKKDAIIVNMARGAVWDEAAAANAILKGKIGGLGCDVFTTEPLPKNHPFSKIYGFKNSTSYLFKNTWPSKFQSFCVCNSIQ